MCVYACVCVCVWFASVAYPDIWAYKPVATYGNFKRPVFSIVWCLRGCWCGMLDEGGLLKVVVVVVIEEGVAVLVRRGCSSSGSSKTSRCSSSMSVYW